MAAVVFCTILAKSLMNQKSLYLCTISLTKLSKEVSGSSKGGPCFLLGLPFFFRGRHPGNDVAHQLIGCEIAAHIRFPFIVLLLPFLGIIGRVAVKRRQKTHIIPVDVQDNKVIVTVVDIQPDTNTPSITPFCLFPETKTKFFCLFNRRPGPRDPSAPLKRSKNLLVLLLFSL